MFIYTYEEVEAVWDRRNRPTNKGFKSKGEMVSHACQKLGATSVLKHKYFNDYALRYMVKREELTGSKF